MRVWGVLDFLNVPCSWPYSGIWRRKQLKMFSLKRLPSFCFRWLFRIAQAIVVSRLVWCMKLWTLKRSFSPSLHHHHPHTTFPRFVHLCGTFRGSISVVSRPMFASEFSFCSIFRETYCFLEFLKLATLPFVTNSSVLFRMLTKCIWI